MLIRYWVMFEDAPLADVLSLGCGVTAYSKDDALDIINRSLLGNKSLKVAGVVESVDVSKITDPHIRPNMGNPIVRGIWFPLGY